MMPYFAAPVNSFSGEMRGKKEISPNVLRQESVFDEH
jgi:hypothetical protein